MLPQWGMGDHMGEKEKRRKKLPGGIFIILLAFAVLMKNFAMADAESISIWESSGEYDLSGDQSAEKTSGTVGSLSDNLIIVEEEIDLTADDGSLTLEEIEEETETKSESATEISADGFEIKIEPVTETESETETETETESETETETETETEEIPGEPMEELRELLERTMRDRQSHLAIAQYLGLDEMKTAAAKKGMTFKLWVEPGEEAVQNLGLSGRIVKVSCYKLRVQMDPAGKQWMFDTGVALKDRNILDFSLYGDEKMLTLSVPQLYERPLGVRSGNLYEQLKDSWAEDAAEKIPSDERNFELNFFPDREDLEAWKDELKKLYGYEENTEEQYKELLDGFLNELTCAREKEDGWTVYSIEMEMDAVRELYLGWFDLYYNPLKTFGTVTEYEFDQVRTGLGEAFDEFKKVIPENPSLKCYVRDDRLDRIAGRIFVDASGTAGGFVNVDDGPAEQRTDGSGMEDSAGAGEEDSQSRFAQAGTGDSENAETAYIEEDTESAHVKAAGVKFSLEVDADSEGIRIKKPSGTEILRKGYLEFEEVFQEETAGIAGTDINFYVRDEEQEDVYYCNLFSGYFDSATGHYDLSFSLADQETGARTTMRIGSRFTDVVPGESFVWDIDRITLEKNGNSTELMKGQIQVQARPEDLAQLENPVMLFDLSEEELRQAGSAAAQNLRGLFGIEPGRKEVIGETAEKETEA